MIQDVKIFAFRGVIQILRIQKNSFKIIDKLIMFWNLNIFKKK